MLNYICPDSLNTAPGQRKATDYQTPSEPPEIKNINEVLEAFIIENPGVPLSKNEKCYCKVKTTLSMKTTKTVKTGGGNYTGISVNLGHGIRYGVGGRTPVKTKQKEITTSSDADLLLTSDQIIIKLKGQVLSDSYDAVTNIVFKFSSFEITFDDTKILFSTDIESCNQFQMIYDFMQIKRSEDEARREETLKKAQQSKSQKNKTSSKDPVALLREYKSLLDDGIITQDEFEAKKKELLKL